MGKAAAPFPRCPQALVPQILSGCSGPQGRRGSVPPWGLGRGSPVPQPPPPGTVALGVLRQDQSPALVAMERAVRVLGRAAKSPKKALLDLFQLSGIVAHPQSLSLPTLGSQPVVGRCSLGRAGPYWWHWRGTGGALGAQEGRRASGRQGAQQQQRLHPEVPPRPLLWKRGAAWPGLARPGPAGGGRGRPRTRCPVPGALPAHPVLPGPAVWCPRPAPVPP